MFKIFGSIAAEWLTAKLKQVEANLGSDIQQLASLLSASVRETGAALDTKQDIPLSVSCTIPVSGWASDSTADYPKYYDISVSSITAKDRAEVTLAPASLSIASKCGLCCTCETLNGKIRLRAKSVPTAAMTAEYWVEKGKENN